jgi:hypothetical protein
LVVTGEHHCEPHLKRDKNKTFPTPPNGQTPLLTQSWKLQLFVCFGFLKQGLDV